MAEFLVRHSLNSSKAVKFNITLRYFVISSEKAEHMWVLEIGTTYPGIGGTSVPAQKTHLISLDNFDKVIEDTVSLMCKYIDWSPFIEDKSPPVITSVYPTGDNVSISTGVGFTITDKLPSAGVDLSEVRIFLNNSMSTFEITDEVRIDGDPSSYDFMWSPKVRVFNTYD